MLRTRDFAIAFLEEFLRHVNPSRDWSGLELKPDSFISPQYSAQYADTLYGLKQGEDETLIYFLIEHKSQQHYWTLRYMSQQMDQIWRKWQETKGGGKKYWSVIVPIILHQAATTWTAPTRFEQYFKEPGKYTPRFSAELVDLAAVPMQTLTDPLLETILSLMLAVRQGHRKSGCWGTLTNYRSRSSNDTATSN